jgi:hypothetical protein
MKEANKVEKENRLREAARLIRNAADQWERKHGRSYMFRQEVAAFSGVAAGTQANHDSKKIGIPGAFKLHGRVAYPLEAVVENSIENLEI